MTTTATVTTSPHFSRVDLAERALQAHQRLQSRAVTEEVSMEDGHEHDEHDEIELEEHSIQGTQQRQQRQQHLDHVHNGWVVHPTTEENNIGEEPVSRGILDDDEEEEEEFLTSRNQLMGTGYSTEPELEPQAELPSLPSYQMDVEDQDQDQEESGDEGEEEHEEEEEEEGEEEEEHQHGDGDEAASGLLSLSRG